jgi:dTDP-4-amino-4,6-dideoxygalactose transaminase
MKVPLLDVNAQNLPLEAELKATFERVLRSGRFIMGPEVEGLEGEVAELSESRFGIGTSSGTDALLLALMSLGIGPGDEVLVPTFTFFATAGCVCRVGAVPVMVDVCPVCFNMDAGKAAEKITEKTRAMIPVHLFGQAADMQSLQALARDHDLRVIEDAAQAIGAKYHGKPCGSFGEMGTFSFFPSKNLGGFGDGGMVVTSDAQLAERAAVLRNHGSHPKYFHKFVGANFRLDSLQAALLRVKLKHYQGYTAKRQANAQYYLEKLRELPGVMQADPEDCCCPLNRGKGSSGEARLVLPVAYPHNHHIWNQFTLRVPGGRRDALKEALGSAGIGAEIYYPLSLDQQECFQDLPEHCLESCPTAHGLAEEVLSVPIYPELTREMQDYVVRVIAEFLEGEG